MTELESPLVDAARAGLEGLGRRRPRVVAAALGRFAAAPTWSRPRSVGGDYLVGDPFSVADVVVGGVLTSRACRRSRSCRRTSRRTSTLSRPARPAWAYTRTA